MSGVTQLVKMGAKGVDALVDALRAGKKAAPQDEALALAQQRAALPIEQGGLGLPPTNTAMDRAKAMGFDTDVYHATPADFNSINISPYRGAAFVASSPDKALRGANAGIGDRFGAGSNVDKIMPMLARSNDVHGLTLTKQQKDWFSSLPNEASESQVMSMMEKNPKNGYWFQWFDEIQTPDGFKYVKKQEPKITYEQASKTKKDLLGNEFSDYSNASNERFASEMANQSGKKAFLQNDEAGLSMAVTNPEMLRSRFAAFDPWRKTAAVAATMGVAAPNLLAEELRKK